MDTIRESLRGRRAAIELREGRQIPEGAPTPTFDSVRARDSVLKEIRDIDDAIRRIDRGSYGRCERCGHALGWQRLRAIPEGRHCSDCDTWALGVSDL